METVSPQKVNFTINHLNTLPFPFRFVTSLQDLGSRIFDPKQEKTRPKPSYTGTFDEF